MISNFLVSVGGTGAKVCESLVHLCAAGYLGQGVDSWLHCMMIDPDTSNGTLARCLRTLDVYRQCRRIGMGDTVLFGADIGNNARPYTPVEPTRNTMNAMFDPVFKAERGTDRERSEAILLRSLFSEDELAQPLEQGFRGRPAIGAVSFGRSVNFNEGDWREFAELIRQRAQNGTVRILFAGSVFGGSGAAGMPTLVRLIHDEFAEDLGDKLEIGLLLFQPYFDFMKVDVEQGSIAAKSEDFALATAEALQYYSNAGYFTYCRSIYTVGEQSRAYIPKGGESEGGEEQKNPPHYLELIGALGAVEFFRGSRSKNKLFLAARASNDEINWRDLPQPDLTPSESTTSPDASLHKEPRSSFEDKFARMARFAVAYHHFFYSQVFCDPRLRSTFDVYTDSIPGAGEPEALRNLQTVDGYCKMYLEWLLSVLRPSATGFDLQLFRVEQIGHKVNEVWKQWEPAEYKTADLGKGLSKFVLQAAGRPDGPDLTKIYLTASEKMRDLKSEPVRAGRVVRSIYEAS